jgi:DNA-binding GntR family transcriptional regulator
LKQASSKRRLGDDYPPLHGMVIDELRQAILSGRLKPGERLVEERLAEEFGVSRNPVREAIRALASQGLIEVTARRGASVVNMTEQEARETIEVRALLEGHNARLAARRRDKDVIKRIQKVLRKGSQAVASGRPDELTELNLQFHRELGAAGQNTVLGDVLKILRERTAILFSPTDPIHQQRSWDEHAAILRAIIDGEQRRAATLAAEHVIRAGSDYLLGLNYEEDTFFPIDGSTPKAHSRLSQPRAAPPKGPGQEGGIPAGRARTVHHLRARKGKQPFFGRKSTTSI